ncbi:MAG: methyltransferase family protein [Saccharospirillum sp.]
MIEIDTFVRHFLAIYFLLIGVQYSSVALGLWRRSGISHIKYGPRGSRTWWYRHTFNAFRAAILGIVLARVVWPIDNSLGIIPALYQPAVLLTGVMVLLVSFGLVGYVHSYMRQDWRSGIDPEKRQPLLTQGPFARSRNPLFLAIMLGQFGFFLALPSLFSLVCLIAGVAVLIGQSYREEAALGQTYGETYLAYRQRVPRWM